MTDAQRARFVKTLREFHEDMGEPQAEWSDEQLFERTSGWVAAMFWLDMKRNSLEYNTVTL